MCRVFGCVAAEPVSIRSRAARGGQPADPPVRGARLRLGNGRLRARRRRRPALRALPRGRLRATPSSSRRPTLQRAHLQRARAPRDDGRPRTARTRTRSASAATRSATTARSCATRGCSRPERRASPPGETDSEAFFNFLMHDYDASDPIGSLRCAIRTAIERSPVPGLNFLFSDGERLYAYRLGIFELHWLHRARAAAGRLRARHRRASGTASSRTCCSCSTRTTSSEPHAERLVGDDWLARRGSRRSITRLTCAARPAARSPPSALGRQWQTREPPLRAARQPGVRRGQGAEGAARSSTRRSTASAPRTARSPRAAASTPPRRRPRGRPGRDGRGGRRRRPAAPARRARSRAPDAALAIIPGGRGNDFARVLGIPTDPAEAAEVAVTARSGCSTSPTSTARRSSASPASASTPTPTGSPTRRSSSGATSSTCTRRCARSPPGSRPPSRSPSTASAHALSGYSVAVGNSKAYGGGMYVCPAPSSTTASSTC